MAKRQKTWVERINYSGIDSDLLIDYLEYAVYQTCKRLGWDMSRVREGEGFRKIETWLFEKSNPQHIASNVDIFLNADSDDPSKIVHKIVYRGDLVDPWAETQSKAEADVFMGVLRKQIEENTLEWQDKYSNNRWTKAARAGAEKPEKTKQKGRSGRPSYEEDMWAWEQVNTLQRPKGDVHKEWLTKINLNSKRNNNIDLDRQFNRITSPKWPGGTKETK